MEGFEYKITVIIPSYNNGQYLKQSIDSVLKQQVEFSYQIIITDDCSNDNSIEIIKEYTMNYSEKIVGIYSEINCGLFSNCLKALKKMNSQYFCVLDPDDYWTDIYWLQKSIEFLDKNTDYTIYATNLYKLYNDGTLELKYDYQGLTSITSTYEDFILNRAVLSCTPSSMYRNIYFCNGIPDEYIKIQGSNYEECFRADAARNLLHLKRGKSYFLNVVTAICRYHGNGLSSSQQKYEQCIAGAYAYIAFYNFFGKENLCEYIMLVREQYIHAVKEYYLSVIYSNTFSMKQKIANYFDFVSKWLQQNTKYINKEFVRFPFSLSHFLNNYNQKYVIWGTGSGAEKLIKKYHINLSYCAFFVDNSEKKQGTFFMQKEIKRPSAIKEEINIIVIIASSFDTQIIKQIRAEQLCHDYNIVNLYDYDKYGIE